MAEALSHAFLCGFGGVVVFLAIVGLCKIVDDLSTDDSVVDPTEPRE